MWEAAQDTTLIILMVAAVVSLAAEMYSEVLGLNLHLEYAASSETTELFTLFLLSTLTRLDKYSNVVNMLNYLSLIRGLRRVGMMELLFCLQFCSSL